MSVLQITISAAIAVSIIGGSFSVIVAIVGGKYLLASKREERIAKQETARLREVLADVYDIAQHPPDGYEWLVINKYTHLDSLHTGYCVIDPARQEEFISDGLCEELKRTRAQIGKKVRDVAKIVAPGDVERFEQLLIGLLDDRYPRFEMTKHIQDIRGEIQVYNIRAVKDGAFILAVYDRV